MIDNISRLLIYKSFQKIVTNVDGVQIFFVDKEKVAYVIVVSNFSIGNEFTKAQYDNIFSQIKKQFEQRGFLTVRLLSLVCTSVIEKAKPFCEEGQICHWIVDQNENKLVIYENQDTDFLGVKELLEGILIGKLHKVETGNMKETDHYKNRVKIKSSIKKKIWNVKNEIKRRDVPMCTTVLVAGNILIYLLLELLGKSADVLTWGSSYYPKIVDEGQYYRLITHMFLHVDFEHIMGNMLVLFFIGERLERIVKKTKFLFVYFGAGILAGTASMSYNMMQGQNISSVGASGAIFGIVGAMAYIVIVNRGRISDITPTRMALFILLTLMSGFSSPEVDNGAHIAGFLAGLLIGVLLYRRTSQKFE